MKKSNRLLCIFLVLLLVMCTGCSKHGDEKLSDKDMLSEESSTEVNEDENLPMGFWSLEDCKNKTGLYIAHEDGTFSLYYGGGYFQEDGMSNANGMFMQNIILELNDPIERNDKLVLFCDTNYTITMLPVNWEIGVIYNQSQDGTAGYTRAYKDEYGVQFLTYYTNHQTAQVKIRYIDDIPVMEYPFEVVQGGPRNTTGYGFPKDSTLKFGTQNGSSLEEREFDVNATYFDCEQMRTLGSVSEEEYCLYPTPTTEGYAVVDFYDGLHDREIPAGKYVMELRMGRSYIAYLINLEN